MVAAVSLYAYVMAGPVLLCLQSDICCGWSSGWSRVLMLTYIMLTYLMLTYLMLTYRLSLCSTYIAHSPAWITLSVRPKLVKLHLQSPSLKQSTVNHIISSSSGRLIKNLIMPVFSCEIKTLTAENSCKQLLRT